MDNRIERIRARLLAAEEGYCVHIGCGGEVDLNDQCAACGKRVPLRDVALPSDLRLNAAEDVRILLGQIDTVVVMPSADS